MALPSLKELFVTVPLYETLEVNKPVDGPTLARLGYSGVGFETLCPHCKKDRVFRTLGSVPYKDFDELSDYAQATLFSARRFVTSAACSWSGQHTISCWWIQGAGELTKVGQFPSLADLGLPELEKYQRVLDSKWRMELHRAIGLAAHGVGIGSFVYLRRVFEGLLLEHYQRASVEGLQVDNFERLRVDEKITALKSALPPFLVEHAVIYGILSKGLHELDEKTCLAAFPAVKSGIALILEQDLQRQARAELENEVSRSIKSIAALTKGA